MVDNQARDVGASGSAHGQEVRINAKLLTNPIQGFPYLGTLWTQGGCGATQLHSFQPGGFSSLVSFSHICRWSQRLRWLGRTRRRLKLRYQNVKHMLLAFFQRHYHYLLIFYQKPVLSGLMLPVKVKVSCRAKCRELCEIRQNYSRNSLLSSRCFHNCFSWKTNSDSTVIFVCDLIELFQPSM